MQTLSLNKVFLEMKNKALTKKKYDCFISFRLVK